jgi:hypothetical protein
MPITTQLFAAISIAWGRIEPKNKKLAREERVFFGL